MRRRTAAMTALATLALAAPAAAHVTVSPTEAEAGGYAKLDLRVPHGCGESPTTGITVRIPEGINAATPQVVPGWTIRRRMQALDPPIDDGHGGTIAERVDTVTWTGGPLAPDQLTEFGLSVRMPHAAGETLAFPVVQRCADGVTRWIQVAAEGEDAAGLEEPAPLVTPSAPRVPGPRGPRAPPRARSTPP